MLRRTNPVLILLFSIFGSVSWAQTEPPKTEEVKTFEMFDIQSQPVFPGGEAAMMQFISENLQYPALARESNVQGTVILSFTIDKDGSILDVKILKDIGSGCGKESMRVIESMPKWTPGEANGHPVRVRYTLPVRFRLDGDTSPGQRPPMSLEDRKPLSNEQMWALVAETSERMGGVQKPAQRNTAILAGNAKSKLVFKTLEITFQVKTSRQDCEGFKNLGELADYFYQAQYAPQFFTRTNFDARSAKILTSRADFDANADGLGRIGSIKVPKGSRILLYSKKNFKGKKLELNAQAGALEIPDLSMLIEEKGRIKNKDKEINWSLNTQSVKIILPKGFPENE